MLEVIISWIYMGALCAAVGFGFWKVLVRAGVAGTSSLVKNIITGIVVITVYTEYMSILYKIAFVAQIILLIPACLIVILYHAEILPAMKKYIQKLFSWEGFFFMMLALFFAFYTSRGTFHTDTNIYHAANIRIYEEVGLIKGMANLQWNFGYNSASLAFASFFSMGWLLPHPIHTTTGFMELVLAGYTCHHLKDWKKHTSHLGDASCIAIWIYFWDMITYSMSPATDYAAMMLALYGNNSVDTCNGERGGCIGLCTDQCIYGLCSDDKSFSRMPCFTGGLSGNKVIIRQTISKNRYLLSDGSYYSAPLSDSKLFYFRMADLSICRNRYFSG